MRCGLAGGEARSEPASATEQAVAYLRTAASGKRLPPAQVLAAILALEKAKLPVRMLCACSAHPGCLNPCTLPVLPARAGVG